MKKKDLTDGRNMKFPSISFADSHSEKKKKKILRTVSKGIIPISCSYSEIKKCHFEKLLPHSIVKENYEQDERS